MTRLVRPLGHFVRPLLLLLIFGFVAIDVSAQSHFSCVQGTGNIFNSTVIVTTSSAPELDGVPLKAGTEIAVFSADPSYAGVCVGKLTWQESNGSITVWGDDELTVARDGLQSGDELRFRIWDPDSGTEYSAEPENVIYLNGTGEYEHDAAFVLSQISVITQSLGLVANDDVASTDEEQNISIDVLANDEAGSSSLDPASVAILVPPGNGTVVDIDSATGAITYLPDEDFAGSDSLVYAVYDLTGNTSQTASVNIAVQNINDPPFAAEDAAITNEDADITIDVLSNDSDVDGDSLDAPSIHFSMFPTGGQISLLDTSAVLVVYQPNANFSGSDSFAYTVEDEHGLISNEALVHVTVIPVNDIPVFDGHPITNTSINYPYDYTAHFTDIENDDVVISASVLPPWLTLTDNGDGSADLRGIPSDSDIGSFAVELSAEDNQGGIGMYAFTIFVDNHAPPVATSDVVTTTEDADVLIDVLANDIDPDGDDFDISTLSIVRAPLHGIVGYIYPESGEITYKPHPEFSGVDSFEYRISDVTGSTSNIVLVSITVIAVNDPPVAIDDSIVTREDIPAISEVLTNDSDIDGDSLRVSSAASPEHGSVIINPDEKSITYTPPPDFNGTDTFIYTVSDPDGLSATAAVTVDVSPENDEPYISSAPGTLPSPGIEYHYVVEFGDVDGDDLILTVLSSPSWLALVSDQNGGFSLIGTPSSLDIGTYEVLLQVSDGIVAVQQHFSLFVSDENTPLTSRAVLRTPAWGAINIPSDTQFSWERIDGATLYQLQVADRTDDQFENPLQYIESIDASTIGTTLFYYKITGLPEITPLIWRVRAQNASGFSPWSDVSQYRTAGETTTPNEVADELPVAAELLQNYPNPFNPTTTIAFELPAATDVSLKIYDLMGREVTTLVSRTLPAGRHEVRWDAGDRASGLYLYRLNAGSYVKSKILSLVK